MPEINQHIDGPLVALAPHEGDNFLNVNYELHDGYGRTATVYGDPDDPETKATSRLLAAAYNAFDKAGRQLGIDAAELAELLDIAETVRCLTNIARTPKQGESDVDGYKQDWLDLGAERPAERLHEMIDDTRLLTAKLIGER